MSFYFFSLKKKTLIVFFSCSFASMNTFICVDERVCPFLYTILYADLCPREEKVRYLDSLKNEVEKKT